MDINRSMTFTLLVGTLLIGGLATFYVAQQKAEPVEYLTYAEVGFEQVSIHCARCHAITATDVSSNASAPPFRELHLKYDVTLLSEALVEGLITHPDMPEFQFDPQQAEGIITYLSSLQPQ